MKIVFLGNPEFAATALRRIAGAGCCDIVGVVTMPDKKGGRGNKVIESDVKRAAVELGISTIMQPASLKDPAFLEQLRSLDADLFVVIAFRMLPEAVWAMPPLGTFNLHASLLPLYRGAAPIQRAVMNGDAQTGVTTFFLRHELDTGAIIDRVAIEVGPDENVGSVHDRLMDLGADLTVKTIRQIAAGQVVTTEQEATGIAPTPAPKIFKETCQIDWSWSTARVHNHVRGLSPYPGAWTAIQPQGAAPVELKVLATRRTADATQSRPVGTLWRHGKQLMAQCADGVIEIAEVQPAGKRRMTADEYLRGSRWDTATATAL